MFSIVYDPDLFLAFPNKVDCANHEHLTCKDTNWRINTMWLVVKCVILLGSQQNI